MILYNLKLTCGSGIRLAEPLLIANLALTSANNETFITDVMSNTVHNTIHLADKIAQKDTEPYHDVITWLRTQISFELLRSVHACVRGSPTPFRSKIEQSLDCEINVASADI